MNKRKQGTATDVDMEAVDNDEGRDEDVAAPSILSDPRFAKVFENPEFAIDENSREFALLNPSSVGQVNPGKTVVEEEEEESDKLSSDGLNESDDRSQDDDNKIDSSDSSDEGELTQFDRRSRPGQRNIRAEEAYERDRARNRAAKVNMVPIRPQTMGSNNTQRPGDKDATFGQRRMPPSTNTTGKSSFRAHEDDDAMEISWVPTSATGEKDNGDRQSKSRTVKDKRRKGVETFGAGLERGVERMEFSNDSERKGRSHRRNGVRSGSKNTFRRR